VAVLALNSSSLEIADMISEIIPTCEFLHAAFGSAMVQSPSPREDIVGDNCTIDVDHESLLDGVTTYRLPQRLGSSRANNIRTAMATGIHFAFFNDDDWANRNFLRETWAALRTEQARCACGRLDVYRENRIAHLKRTTLETLTIPTLLQRNPKTTGTNFLIKTTLFWDVGGFDEQLRTSEDKALVLEILSADERIAIAPDAFAIMRDLDGIRASQDRHYKLLFSRKFRSLIGYRGLFGELFRFLNPRLRKKLAHNADRVRRTQCV
jgi:GT2 family glycosyltransferase